MPEQRYALRGSIFYPWNDVRWLVSCQLQEKKKADSEESSEKVAEGEEAASSEGEVVEEQSEKTEIISTKKEVRNAL